MEEKILFVLKNVLGLRVRQKALSQQNWWINGIPLRHFEFDRGVGIRVWCRVRSGGDLQDECFEDIESGVLTQNCDMDSVDEKPESYPMRR